ncbi:Transcription elongation regulator 1 [Hypsizygus marmoreus]|uniref:Transcription elongation regulator 1 n=1 Tax=Hypsizygus marmoreus TaxID=39966 RepID=A0A369JM02_HYPMA|nr:Transcription elongation regulator 1 [Hypsizygus marmoreus]
MAAPSFTPMGPPPLPVGWSEHIGPAGQVYYYNTQTQESTYVRPVPAFHVMPTIQSEPVKRKEKPLVKTPIPGTEWLRVRTTEGNIFYSHKVKKESVWVVPDDIKDAVEKLEKDERRKQDKAERDTADEASRAERERVLEVERVKGEVQELVKRKAEDSTPLDEIVVAKKAKIEEEDEEEEAESDESEEEEWQREAAAQLAAEAEAERKRLEEEAEREKTEAETEAKRIQSGQLNMPGRVDLSIDEAKALFKTLLREKDINPLHPWDTSLPKFVSDPRYVLLPSVAARRDAFDEYCRDRARELRQSAVKKEKEIANPKDDFDRLLRDEVKSTRTSWSDFRRAWKKDRRFYGWGRDDREREKKFREYVKDLGEKKRAMAQKAELDFFGLLRERGVGEGSVWKEIKRKLYDDPRYDAVGSSSLREELFNTFLKGSHPPISIQSTESTPMMNKEDDELADLDETEKQQRRKERKERAVKEREQKVRMERDRLESDIGRSRMDIYKEEGERDFKSLLTDAVRDPQVTWDAALPQLKTDPRFRNSPLPPNQQLHLFHSHVDHLRSKHIVALHVLFETHAPSLAVQFDDLPITSLLSSGPAVKLGYDQQRLERDFEKWQRERTHESRKAFDEMLSENSFVEFWGRLGKIGGEGVEGGVKADEVEGDEGEGGGGKVDMKVLAKNVDVGDMEKVLKNDKRYIMFDHAPEQRERWIRDYLSNLSAPKLSVHIPQTALT